MPEDLFDGKLLLVQIMAWCHQETSHYMNQCWERSLTVPELKCPQWHFNIKIGIPILNIQFDIYNGETYTWKDENRSLSQVIHDGAIKCKHFPRYWPFVRGIPRSLVNSPHKGQWCRALMFSLICAWINGWVNNLEAGDLRCHHAHYDITIMGKMISKETSLINFDKQIFIEVQLTITQHRLG